MPGDRTDRFKNHKTGTVSGKPEIMDPLILKSCFPSHVISHFIPSISLIFLSKLVYILAERFSLPLATKLALCGINCVQMESMVSM
jgi:hypothetical protein